MSPEVPRCAPATLSIARATVRDVRPVERMKGRQGRTHMTALIVALVSIAVVWLVVIYGSIYVNKNVQ